MNPELWRASKLNEFRDLYPGLVAPGPIRSFDLTFESHRSTHTILEYRGGYVGGCPVC
jgi:hypothetical protein